MVSLMAAGSDRRDEFEELFAAHYWAVRDFVLRRVPASTAEDVVAETFLIAWRRLAEIEDDPLPWLLGVARRVVANQLRADRRRGALRDRLRGTVGASAPEWEPPVDAGSDLGQALASLSQREREALLLVAWEGLDAPRAARVLGCSAATFRVRLHRARRRVAGQLSDPAINRTPTRVTEEMP
jgi:RNA polymerase sigma-70 factor, ECF subfamily